MNCKIRQFLHKKPKFCGFYLYYLICLSKNAPTPIRVNKPNETNRMIMVRLTVPSGGISRIGVVLSVVNSVNEVVVVSTEGLLPPWESSIKGFMKIFQKRGRLHYTKLFNFHWISGSTLYKYWWRAEYNTSSTIREFHLELFLNMYKMFADMGQKLYISNSHLPKFHKIESTMKITVYSSVIFALLINCIIILYEIVKYQLWRT